MKNKTLQETAKKLGVTEARFINYCIEDGLLNPNLSPTTKGLQLGFFTVDSTTKKTMILGDLKVVKRVAEMRSEDIRRFVDQVLIPLLY